MDAVPAAPEPPPPENDTVVVPGEYPEPTVFSVTEETYWLVVHVPTVVEAVTVAVAVAPDPPPPPLKFTVGVDV
jgi:hypothetical protein